MTSHPTDPADDGGADAAVDAALRRHFVSATTGSALPEQPPIDSLLPRRRTRGRWWAPAAVAGGLVAAVTATVLVVSPGPRPPVNGIDQPPEELTVSGREYELVGAVPWYRAMRSGNTVAVTTGPETRGACASELYRLTVAVRGDDVVLTSYRYDPVDTPGSGACLAVGLPTYVAAVNTDLELPDEVLDGFTPSTPARPLTAVLFPRELPAGIIAKSERYPQPANPERPSFPAAPGFTTQAISDGVIAQSYSGGRQWLNITQGSKSLPAMTAQAKMATIGRYRAVLQRNSSPVERCLQWKDDVVGNIEVCGVLSGGDDALIAVARSIYTPTTTASATPSASVEPSKQITVNGAEYTLVGPVSWHGAMRIGNTVAVSTGPEVRGACDEQIYRLEAARSAGTLTLTSYRYDPVKVSEQGCRTIGLAPYVAALELDSPPPAVARDGGGTGDYTAPLTEVLVPQKLPSGFVAVAHASFPQVADPERPQFPASSGGSEQGAVNQNYQSGAQFVTVHQGVKTVSKDYATVGRTSIGPYQATINAFRDLPERCVQWTDKSAGNVSVCGTLDGGADAVVAVARSIYPTR